MTTQVRDEFTDTDSTALTAHTIAPTNLPATAWTAVIGTFNIQSNEANLATTPSTRNMVTCDPGRANCTLSCTVRPTGNAWWCGVAARITDQNNCWLIAVRRLDNVFQIVEVNNSTETVRATASVTISAGVNYAIAVVLDGASITATLDGANQISYSSATFNQTVTPMGLVGGTQTGMRYENFQVEYLPDIVGVLAQTLGAVTLAGTAVGVVYPSGPLSVVAGNGQSRAVIT